jgi:hypothetical protein
MMVHRFNGQSRLQRRNSIDVLFVELTRNRLVTSRRVSVILGNLQVQMIERVSETKSWHSRSEMLTLDVEFVSTFIPSNPSLAYM